MVLFNLFSEVSIQYSYFFTDSLLPSPINDKKELLHAVPFHEFPIGTISKVKKIVLGS